MQSRVRKEVEARINRIKALMDTETMPKPAAAAGGPTTGKEESASQVGNRDQSETQQQVRERERHETHRPEGGHEQREKQRREGGRREQRETPRLWIEVAGQGMESGREQRNVTRKRRLGKEEREVGGRSGEKKALTTHSGQVRDIMFIGDSQWGPLLMSTELNKIA